MLRRFAFRTAACCLLAAAIGACGDDDIDLGSDAGGTTPDASVPDASGTSSGGSTDGGSSGSVDADAGPQSCLPPQTSTGHWDNRFTLAGLTGIDGVVPKVYEMAREADGSLLVAGYFRWAGTTRVDGLARFRNGTWERARDFGALGAPEGGFTAMAIGPNGELALAASLGGAAGSDAIWLDDGTGLREIGRFARRARRMAFVGSQLWVAGGVEFENGGPKGLAIWNGATWQGAAGGDPDGYVYDLLVDGTDVVVSGGFTAIGGVQSARIAHWNGAAWSNEYAFDPDSSSYIASVARDAQGTLHAGGLFAVGDGESESASFAKLTETGWQVAGGGVSITGGTGVVTDMRLHSDGALYVTGCFDEAGGFDGDPGAVHTKSIARWDGVAWTALDDDPQFVNAPWFDFGRCGFEGSPEDLWDVGRQRLLSSGTELVLGGGFAGIDGVPSQSIASHGAEWSALGVTNLGLNGEVASFTVRPDACSLYAVVAATHAGGRVLGSAVQRFTGTGWEDVGPALPARTGCRALWFEEETPVLACEISAPNGAAQPTFFRLQDGAWQAFPIALSGVSQVKQAPDGSIWVSGFAEDGSTPVARWNGTGLDVVEAGFDGPVTDFAFVPKAEGSGFDVVAGGYFTKIGSVQAARVARWDGAAWHAYGSGLTNAVSALGFSEGRLYAASEDEFVPGRILFGAWDGAAWVELATAANGFPAVQADTTATVREIQSVAGGVLVTGGIFTDSGERNVYRFDGASFESVGGGVGASEVTSIAVTPDGYWFGGSLVAEAGAGAGLVSSVGVAHYVLSVP